MPGSALAGKRPPAWPKPLPGSEGEGRAPLAATRGARARVQAVLPTDQPPGDHVWPHLILAKGLAAAPDPAGPQRGHVHAQPQRAVWVAFRGHSPEGLSLRAGGENLRAMPCVGIFASMCQKGGHRTLGQSLSPGAHPTVLLQPTSVSTSGEDSVLETEIRSSTGIPPAHLPICAGQGSPEPGRWRQGPAGGRLAKGASA